MRNIWIIPPLILLLLGCVESSQNLQSINQALGNAQRTVDYANSVNQIPSDQKKQALKNMGKAVIEQNPTVQQANETIKATKALTKSIKSLGQQPPQ
jgi:hypothetical protein